MRRGRGSRTRIEDVAGGSAPTRLEGSPDVGATRLEDEPALGSRRRITAPSRNLPRELAERYGFVFEIPVRGAEADLLVVRHRQSGALRAVKLYRVAVRPPAPELMERIESAEREHVVEVLERGDFDGTWCEVMEYCELGSLADLIENEGPRLSPELAEMAIREICVALLHIHGEPIRITHRDLKPANVLVRSREPLDLVLADFGLATLLGNQSKVLASARRTVAYSAPEAAFGTISPALDWWSLGITAVEMLTGRRPFLHDTGDESINERMASADIVTKPVDLGGIEDERLRLLCSGLTIKNPDHRWKDAQVREWLNGGRPVVVADRFETTSRRRVKAFSFKSPEGDATVDIDDPVELAAAMGVHWDEALLCFSDAKESLRPRRALRDFLRTAGLTDADQILMSSDGDEEDRLVRFRLALDPDADPYFRGELLTDERLRWLAQRAATNGAGADRVAGILDHDVLRLHTHGENAHWSALESRWDENVRWIERMVAAHGGGAVRAEDLQGEVGSRVLARVLYLLLDESAAAQYARRVDRLAHDRAAREESSFATALASADRGPEPARDIFIELLHAPAAGAARERRAARRTDMLRLGRQSAWTSAKTIALLFAALLVGVALTAALTVFHIPKSTSGGAFVTGLSYSYQAAIACAVGCLLAAIMHDAVVTLTGGRTAMWPRLFSRHLLVGLLTIGGFAWLLSTRYDEGARAAPATLGKWLLIGFAVAHILSLLAGLGLRWVPSQRAGMWLVAAAAAATGVSVAAAGMSHDASRMQAAFESHSETLTGALPINCRPVLQYGVGRPPAWLKGATKCRDDRVSVNYTWLADKFLLANYRQARIKASRTTFTGDHCGAAGNFNGNWHNDANPSRSLGQLICYSIGPISHLEWGDTRTGIFAVASRRGRMGPLLKWWKHGREPDPSLLQ